QRAVSVCPGRIGWGSVPHQRPGWQLCDHRHGLYGERTFRTNFVPRYCARPFLRVTGDRIQFIRGLRNEDLRDPGTERSTGRDSARTEYTAAFRARWSLFPFHCRESQKTNPVLEDTWNRLLGRVHCRPEVPPMPAFQVRYWFDSNARDKTGEQVI